MRIFLLFFLLIFSSKAIAQHLKGMVRDATTRLPIENAQVITIKRTVLTNREGKFDIPNVVPGEQLAIRILGYQTMEMLVSAQMLSDSLVINLKQGSFSLKEIAVQAKRNHKIDSINLRKEYAAVFAYRPPDFTDMFIKVDPSYRSPFANVNPNSTASILKFNALSAFGMFKKKNKATSKFKTILEKDEELRYIDQYFSAEKVKALTGLEGDELANFVNKYRPGIEDLKKMTGYELVRYIKKCYAEWRQ